MLDIHVSFREALAPEVAREVLRPWNLRVELYGPSEVRGARLTGQLEREVLGELLGAGLLGGPLRAVEVGRRGFLRSEDGRLEWMPWRRNVVAPREQARSLELADGVRYVLE